MFLFVNKHTNILPLGRAGGEVVKVGIFLTSFVPLVPNVLEISTWKNALTKFYLFKSVVVAINGVYFIARFKMYKTSK